MRVATKLWIFIVCVIAGIAAVSVVGLVRSSRILAEGRQAINDMADMVKVTAQWTSLTEANGLRNQAIVLSSEPAVEAAFKDGVTATANQVSELQKQIEAMPLNDAGKAQLQKIAELRKTVTASRDKARQARTDGKAGEALAVLNQQYLPAMAAYIAAQKDFVKLLEQRMLDLQLETEQRRVANTTGLVSALAVIVTAILLGTAWLVRSIRDPLQQANGYAERIARGDLSAHIQTARQDEFGQLLHSLGRMNESLGRMVSQVRQSTDSIATASAEIATGNNDLAQRTEQTSSNLQSTASSMDQLTSTVQQSAGNARQASTLATSASAVAEKGGAVVRQVVATMEEINASSKRISDIIGTIDGIAFQTNILALNAAVEAARAGEQGRGFAVVASEVRSLAQRSAEAAKEIKILIGASVERVESGTRLVSDAGATMGEIVQSVRKVAAVISEITATSAEQSAGIAHVNQAVNHLDQMTQQNAALVEQSAAAAESLREQSQQLAEAVSVFKISGVAHASPVLAQVAVRQPLLSA
jgi:methyl-accepting chemotaxis protein